MDLIEIKGKINTAICYARVVEDEAIEQIRRMCDYPMTEGSRIRIMKFKGEMVKDGSAYCIVFCKVLKRDVARFEEALERLKDKMLLLGHKDYPAACGEIAKMIEEDTKARMRK